MKKKLAPRKRIASSHAATRDYELTPASVVEICQRVARKGYKREVEEFIESWRPIEERGETLRLVDDAGVTEGGKWILSLQLLDRYLEVGEQAALSRLPFLLQVDCVFFLGQRWVRELLAQWQKTNKQKEINRLFFGTPKRGVRSYALAVENRQRDMKITAAVETLLQRGCGYNETMKVVARGLQELGIPDKLTASAVRHRYEKWKKGDDPLIRLLSLNRALKSST